MTLRTGEDILIWRRKLWIAPCGGIVLEEALGLSSDRILNEWISFVMKKSGVSLRSLERCIVGYFEIKTKTQLSLLRERKTRACTMNYCFIFAIVSSYKTVTLIIIYYLRQNIIKRTPPSRVLQTSILVI